VHGIDGPTNNTKVILVGRVTNGLSRTVVESHDGGATWTKVADWTGEKPPSRALWVRAVAPVPTEHAVAGGAFDLWFGDGFGVDSVTCKTPVGTGTYCPLGTATQNGGPTLPWRTLASSHPDVNGIAIKPSTNCPKLLLSDGGVDVASDCGTTWSAVGAYKNGTHGGFNALQVYSVSGQVRPTFSNPFTELYFGTQDNAIWTSPGDNGYTWNRFGAEGYHFGMAHSSLDANTTMVAVDAGGGGLNTFISHQRFADAKSWVNPPNTDAVTYPGSGETFYYEFARDSTDQKYSLYGSTIAFSGSFSQNWERGPTMNLGTGERMRAEPPVVTQNSAGPFVNVYGATTRADSTTGLVLVQLATVASFARADRGLSNIATFCYGDGTFVCPAVFGVNATGERLLVADAGTKKMRRSNDAGATWSDDTVLTSLVTNGAKFAFAGVGYSQAHVIAYDPANSDRILVGTESSGVLASADNGATWSRIPGSEKILNVSSFFFDEFRQTVIVGSYGRGLWTIELPMFFSATSVQRSNRTGDWQFGALKAECGDSEMLVGLSKSTQGSSSHGALCRPGNINDYPHISCTVRNFSAGESRGANLTDWDPGYFKGECAAAEYAAGVSQSTDGKIMSILCCVGAVTHNTCSRVSFETQEGHEDASNGDWDFGFYKGDCGAGRYVAGMSRDPAGSAAGSPHAIYCCSP